MKFLRNKIFKIEKKKLIIALVFSLIFIITPKFVFASWLGLSIGHIADGVILTIVGILADICIKIAGVFMGVIMRAVVSFSSYNHFIHEPAIQEAWKIVSSFCNMFFILIVLIIAFANILNIDSYRIKSTLPKVIIMAILINFSLMICGLLIDFSQIFMMTFVNAIGTNGGNYVKIFQIKSYFKEVDKNKWSGNVDVGSAIVGMFAALIFMLVALVVLVYVLMIIVMRIVMLWIYSILSPFAFVLSAFPAGKPYAAKWWDRFSKELIVGPVLMFFVWLAFYIASESSNLARFDGECSGGFELLCPTSFLPFFMGVALLIGGLKITQEIGGVTGGLAGGAMNRIQQGKNWGTNKLKNFGKNRAKDAGRFALRTGVGATGALLAKTPLNKIDSLNKLGKVGLNFREDAAEKNREDKEKKRLATLQKWGMGRKSLESLDEFQDTKLARYGSAATKGAGLALAGVATGGLAGFVPMAGLAGTALKAGAVYHTARTVAKGQADKKEQERKDKRDGRISLAKQARDKAKEERDDVFSRRDEEINEIRTRLQADVDVGNINEDEMNRKLNIKIQPIIEKYKNDIESANKKLDSAESNYQSEKTEAWRDYNQERHDRGKFEKWSENWHPTQVTKGAAKRGIKESIRAEKRRDALYHGEDIRDFGKSWYSLNGQTSEQKRNFDSIISDDPKSVQALNNILNTLEKMDHNSLTNFQKGNIENFKKGIAAYKRGGGDEDNKLQPIINILNQIPSGENGEIVTVEEYQDRIIEST